MGLEDNSDDDGSPPGHRKVGAGIESAATLPNVSPMSNYDNDRVVELSDNDTKQFEKKTSFLKTLAIKFSKDCLIKCLLTSNILLLTALIIVAVLL